MDTSQGGRPGVQPGSTMQALILTARFRHLLGGQPVTDLKSWKNGISNQLRQLGLSEECLYKDFPNTEAHRENNRLVKLWITQKFKISGMGRYFPSALSTPRQFCELLYEVIVSRYEASIPAALLEFATTGRHQYDSYEAMMLRIIYLRQFLEKYGIMFTDRAAAHIVLNTLAKDVSHSSWIKALFRKDKGSSQKSVIWDDLMMKLWELSLSEQAGVAGVVGQQSDQMEE